MRASTLSHNCKHPARSIILPGLERNDPIHDNARLLVRCGRQDDRAGRNLREGPREGIATTTSQRPASLERSQRRGESTFGMSQISKLGLQRPSPTGGARELEAHHI
jgi:hypothetical protein